MKSQGINKTFKGRMGAGLVNVACSTEERVRLTADAHMERATVHLEPEEARKVIDALLDAVDIAEHNRIQAQGAPQSDQEAEEEPVGEEHKYTTVEGHPIEVGQWYASGMGKVLVIAIRGHQATFPVIAISHPDENIRTYRGDGHFGVGGNYTSYDLMRPCDPPEEQIDYPWGDFPLSKWAATYKDGAVDFFAGSKPEQGEWGWLSHGGPRWRHPTYRRDGADPATSLRKRPEGV